MHCGTGGDWFLIVRSVLRVFVDFGEFGVDDFFFLCHHRLFCYLYRNQNHDRIEFQESDQHHR